MSTTTVALGLLLVVAALVVAATAATVRPLASVLYDRAATACEERLHNFTAGTLDAMQRVAERGRRRVAIFYVLADVRCGEDVLDGPGGVDTLARFVSALCAAPNHFYVQCDPAKLEAPPAPAAAADDAPPPEKMFVIHVHARGDADVRACDCAPPPSHD